eukprot:3259527-Rhodomonas_salina.1
MAQARERSSRTWSKRVFGRVLRNWRPLTEAWDRVKGQEEEEKRSLWWRCGGRRRGSRRRRREEGREGRNEEERGRRRLRKGMREGGGERKEEERSTWKAVIGWKSSVEILSPLISWRGRVWELDRNRGIEGERRGGGGRLGESEMSLSFRCAHMVEAVFFARIQSQRKQDLHFRKVWFEIAARESELGHLLFSQIVNGSLAFLRNVDKNPPCGPLEAHKYRSRAAASCFMLTTDIAWADED